MAGRCRFVGVGVAIALLAAVHTARGDRELYTHDSPAIAGNEAGISSERRVVVYTPPGYTESTEHYPTVYYLPGWGGGASLGNSGPQALDAAIEAGELPPVVVVGVSGSVRPVQGIMFVSSLQFGDWEGYLIDELIPWVDSNCRTIPDWRKRALTGWSAGGYSALLLPLLRPEVWGAMGANDPWTSSGCVRGAVQVREFAEILPIVSAVPQRDMQFAARIAPNPDSPLGFDQPRNLAEARDAEIWDEWKRTFCLSNADANSGYSEELAKLSSIVFVSPLETSGTNTVLNNTVIAAMEAAGADITRLDMPGNHTTDAAGRFMAIAQQVVPAMNAVDIVEPGTVVRTRGKLATTWASLRSGS